MKKIELKFIESWGETRKRGRHLYAFRTGVSWSVITAFLVKIFELKYYSFGEVYLSQSFLNFFSFFVIIGVMIFWKFVWEFNERRYKKLVKMKENESNS